MNNTKSERLRLSRKVVDAYCESGKIDAAIIGGSVALGLADRFSDIDLFIFWKEPPSEDERRQAVLRSGGTIEVNWTKPPSDQELQQIQTDRNGKVGQIWPYESDEWSEHYYLDQADIGISGFLSSTVERYLADVSKNEPLADEKQILLAAVNVGTPLAGRSVLERWKNTVAAYPKELALALVNEAIAFNGNWAACDMFASRNERLIVSRLIVGLVDQILRALLALNRIFLPDPRHKWLNYYSAEMDHQPPDLAARIMALAEADPVSAVAKVQQLFLETLDLIDIILPGAETEFARLWIQFRRAVSG